MIKLDALYVGLFAGASVSLAFAFVTPETLSESNAFGLLVAFMLLMFGVVGTAFTLRYLGKKPTQGYAPVTTDEDGFKIGLGVLLALILFILSNKFVPQLSVVTLGSLSIYTFFGTFAFSITTVAEQVNALLFSVFLIPVSEETFFRGFIANLMIGNNKGGPRAFVGLILQAGIFMLFHVGVYGFTDALLVIFADGLIIGAIDLETQRLSTGTLAHMLNNLLAYGLATGAIAIGGTAGAVATLPVMLGFLGVVKVRKRLGPSVRR